MKKLNEFERVTTKGYVINIYNIMNTLMGDIICYMFNDEFKRSKIRYNGKGPYFEVRQHGKYYGRCYI